MLAFICFVTARKRSLGRGNVFTHVCHSVHRRRVCLERLCLGRSLSGEGLSGVSVRDTPLTEIPPYCKEQAVRILLECILVVSNVVTD